MGDHREYATSVLMGMPGPQNDPPGNSGLYPKQNEPAHTQLVWVTRRAGTSEASRRLGLEWWRIRTLPRNSVPGGRHFPGSTKRCDLCRFDSGPAILSDRPSDRTCPREGAHSKDVHIQSLRGSSMTQHVQGPAQFECVRWRA